MPQKLYFDCGFSQGFAFAYPDFNANGAVCSEGGGGGVVNIGSEGMQGNTPFLVSFFARHFRTGESAFALDFDAFGAHPAGGLNGFFHHPTEGDSSFQLAGDAFRHQQRFEFGALDLDNIDLDIFGGQFF